MKKTLTLLILFIAGLHTISCDDEETIVCSQTDESAVIEMLADQLDNCTCQISVFRGTFMGQTVYFTRGTAPHCLFAYVDPVLYTCDGSSFTSLLITDEDSFARLVTDREVLYRCDD